MEVAETSEAVSQSADALTQLAILLPSHAALFNQTASHAAHRDGAVRLAGQHSRAWLDASSPSSPEVHELPLFDKMLGATCRVSLLCWLWLHMQTTCCRDQHGQVLRVSWMTTRRCWNAFALQYALCAQDKEFAI